MKAPAKLFWIAVMLFVLPMFVYADKPAKKNEPAAPVSQKADAPKDTPKDAKWVCPMHEKRTAAEKGKCPDCGMQMIRLGLQARDNKTLVPEFAVEGMLFERGTSFAFMAEARPTLRDFCERLRRAAKDQDVKAVVMRSGMNACNPAQLEEIRSAMSDFRKSGKKIYFHADDLELRDFIVAASADEVWMMPNSIVSCAGMRLEMLFFKNLMEKIGVKANIETAGKFKGAGEPFSRDALSPETREAMTAVVNSLHEHFASVIAGGRKIKIEDARNIIDKGPYTSSEALKLKLVDKIGYRRELVEKLSKEFGEGVSFPKKYGVKRFQPDGFFAMMNMMFVPPEEVEGVGTKIAVIYAEGAIHEGGSRQNMFGEGSSGADTLCEAIGAAAGNANVKAIVLRVDSPGGSAVASDAIHEALKLARARKPVIVSMGGTAASGGYYISCVADAIVAEPTTITGSIGVIGGKLNIKGLLDKLGISVDVIQRGDNSSIFSPTSDFTEQERAFIQRYMGETYKDFVGKVAEGRKKPVADIEKIAQGRIWTGVQAKEIGLVDELGGLDLALKIARKKANLKEEDPASLLILPKARKSFMEMYGFGTNVDAATLGPVRQLPLEIQRALVTAQDLLSLPADRVYLLMPLMINIK